MSRTTKAPRLASLVAADLARTVWHAAEHAAGNLAYWVHGSYANQKRPQGASPEQSPLYVGMLAMVEYAQTGAIDWGTNRPLEFANALRNIGRVWEFSRLGACIAEADQARVALALHTAEARCRLDEGAILSTAGLASLANVSLATIRKEQAKGPERGGLPRGGSFDAGDVKAWLAARFVPQGSALARLDWRYCCGGGLEWVHVSGRLLVASVLAQDHGWKRDASGDYESEPRPVAGLA